MLATYVARLLLWKKIDNRDGLKKLYDWNWNFVSQFWTTLLRMFGIKLKMSYAYHQKMNVQTKKINRTLKKC